MIGSLGDAVFTVSDWRVFTFRGFNRSGAPRIEEHAVIGVKPKLEYTGPGLDTINFSVRLDRFLGVTPEDEIDKMHEAMTIGQVVPLIIGGRYLGRWVITALDESHLHYNGLGRLIVAEVMISLKEVADDGDLLSSTLS